MSNKGNLKQLTALEGKKLVKKGKKSPEGVLYHVTKLGQKHSTPASSPEGFAASS